MTDCECLAVLWEDLLLRFFLGGCRITVRTDPYSLKCILNLTDTTEKLMLCRLALSEFEFDIVVRAETKH